MNKIFLILFLWIVCMSTAIKSIAQSINPKQGEITFSWIKTDSVLTELYIEDRRIEPVREQKFTHKFQDNIIEEYSVFRRENGNIEKGKSRFIDRKKRRYYEADSINNPIVEKPYPYITIESLQERFEVSEDKEDQKIIKGYPCYHVIVQGFINYGKFRNVTKTYDLYVTENIKCTYHPVLEAKSFLRNYYPLEITVSAEVENSDPDPTEEEQYYDYLFRTQTGKLRRYTLESITLK